MATAKADPAQAHDAADADDESVFTDSEEEEGELHIGRRDVASDDEGEAEEGEIRSDQALAGVLLHQFHRIHQHTRAHCGICEALPPFESIVFLGTVLCDDTSLLYSLIPDMRSPVGSWHALRMAELSKTAMAW